LVFDDGEDLIKPVSIKRKLVLTDSQPLPAGRTPTPEITAAVVKGRLISPAKWNGFASAKRIECTLTSLPGSQIRRNHKIMIIEVTLEEQSPPGMGGFCNTEKEDKRSAILL
jgi:hypothetical protein